VDRACQLPLLNKPTAHGGTRNPRAIRCGALAMSRPYRRGRDPGAPPPSFLPTLATTVIAERVVRAAVREKKGGSGSTTADTRRRWNSSASRAIRVWDYPHSNGRKEQLEGRQLNPVKFLADRPTSSPFATRRARKSFPPCLSVIPFPPSCVTSLGR
jgi:hypothetical protein